MDLPSPVPVPNGKYHIVNAGSNRVLIDSLNKMLESAVCSTPFPMSSNIGAYIDYFTFTKSPSGNDTWVITGNNRRLSTVGGEGLLLTVTEDEPGYEWDLVASSDFPDSFRIVDRYTQSLIYEREALDVNQQFLDVRYGKIELTRPEAHWRLKPVVEPKTE